MKSGSKIGMSLTFAWLCLCALLVGCPAQVPTDDAEVPDAVADHTMDVDADADADVQVKEAGDGGYDFDLWPPGGGIIPYRGGPVMTNPAHVYLLWYGGWNNNTTVPIVEDFIIGLNSSPYFSITATYYELVPANMLSRPAIPPMGHAYATDVLIFVKSIFPGYSHGTVLSDDDVFSVVSDAVDSQQVPSDPTAIYLVLTSADVKQGSGLGGFCGGYCGWHNHGVNGANDLKYAFIGDPAPCLNSCTVKDKYDEYGITHSPNFNWSADGLVSVIAHELSETITDGIWDTNPA